MNNSTMNLHSLDIKQHKQTTLQILFNIQWKLAKFKNITLNDIKPFYINENQLISLNTKMKSYIISFAKKMELFFTISIPSLYWRFIYFNAYPNTFIKKLNTVSLFTCSTIYLFMHENSKITKKINKEIKQIALDN